ncbi:MAG: Nudix family hydrolase [Thiotrichales bacterium]|nr:MAG: Nudix family hydrolase [Thiotrichales bacterium]
MTSAFIHVAVAAIVNNKGEVLVSQRKQGTHLGGYWEFPGGKLEPGEVFTNALTRELKEELDIVPLASRPLIRARYRYPEKSVLLDVWKVESYSGTPSGVEGQRIDWRRIDQLDEKLFPPADRPVINALVLPERYLITGEFRDAADFERRLSAALDQGIEMVQLRLTHEWLAVNGESCALEIIQRCHSLCQQRAASLLCNMPAQLDVPAEAGIHLNSRRLIGCASRPDAKLVAASCHNREELEHAQSIDVDFAVLSPVQDTRSHANARPLGWARFHALVDDINIPVYALGGVVAEDLETAWQSGGQGIAAISAFWR